MYQTLREPGLRNPEGGMSPAGIEIGLGTRSAATLRMFEQGSLNETGNALDVAIEGDGFFQVYLPDGGMAYTRDGQFKLSSDGTVVTSDGYPLAPMLVLPEGASDLSISETGIVSVVLPGEETAMDIGQIELARFINPSGLKALGGNLYARTDASGDPVVHLPQEDGTGKLRSGYVEASNVKVVEEMVNMITAQRAFEIVSKSIQVSEEMLQTANNMKR
jgi:flagellar basal-body rod protein FlgG